MNTSLHKSSALAVHTRLVARERGAQHSVDGFDLVNGLFGQDVHNVVGLKVLELTQKDLNADNAIRVGFIFLEFETQATWPRANKGTSQPKKKKPLHLTAAARPSDRPTLKRRERTLKNHSLSDLSKLQPVALLCLTTASPFCHSPSTVTERLSLAVTVDSPGSTQLPSLMHFLTQHVQGYVAAQHPHKFPIFQEEGHRLTNVARYRAKQGFPHCARENPI